ncbi:MAG: SprT family zinc-dependent metalloprotease [Rhodospirillaceae bacterium]|nr:SprT family zinc-dependent metalloprotease [Rhodospirillaceae bacterium]
MADGAVPLLAELVRTGQWRERVSARARRVSLRVDVAEGAIVLVRPVRVSEAVVRAFVIKQRRWIERHLATLMPPMALADGATLPVLGRDHTICAMPTAKRGVWTEADVLFVSGATEHLPRRVKDWIKAEAKRTFAAWAHEFARRIDRRVTRVAVRDTASRWGSCSRDGRLSLSWRLFLAPESVARYVVAHEVAHLRHMNHSAAFWRTVRELTAEAEPARQWLRRHGASLHRYT